MKKLLLLVLVGTLLCSGCSNIRVSPTTKGAFIGAGAGAGAGLLLSAGSKGPAGAAIVGLTILGGVIGAIIGSDYDTDKMENGFLYALENVSDGNTHSYIDGNKVFELTVIETHYVSNGVVKKLSVKKGRSGKSVTISFLKKEDDWEIMSGDEKKFRRLWSFTCYEPKVGGPPPTFLLKKT